MCFVTVCVHVRLCVCVCVCLCVCVCVCGSAQGPLAWRSFLSILTMSGMDLAHLVSGYLPLRRQELESSTCVDPGTHHLTLLLAEADVGWAQWCAVLEECVRWRCREPLLGALRNTLFSPVGHRLLQGTHTPPCGQTMCGARVLGRSGGIMCLVVRLTPASPLELQVCPSLSPPPRPPRRGE